MAKGLLPYHGLGSGIKRALSQWPHIDFTDDHDGCLFTTTVLRQAIDPSVLSDESSGKGSGKSSGKTESEILSHLSKNPEMTIPMLADALNITTRAVEKHISKLKQSGKIERIGGRKEGYWNVSE